MESDDDDNGSGDSGGSGGSGDSADGYFDYYNDGPTRKQKEKAWEELDENPLNTEKQRLKLLDMRYVDLRELLDFIAKETLEKIEGNLEMDEPSQFELVYKRGLNITIKYGENNLHTITVYFDSDYEYYDLLINTLMEFGVSFVKDNLLDYFKIVFDYGHFNEDYLLTFTEAEIVFSHLKGLSIIYNVVIVNEALYRIGGKKYEEAKERYEKDIAKFSKK